MPEVNDSPPVAKVLLICGAVILVVWLTCGGILGYFLWQRHLQVPPRGYILNDNRESAPKASLKPLPDADALAARMKWNQAIYQKVRDDALAGYLQKHPNPAPHDDEAHAALRLAAYLSVWGDYYGEGLWQQYDTHVDHLFDEGANFSVFSRMKDVHGFGYYHSVNEDGAGEVTKEALEFSTTQYPALFKFQIYESVLEDLIDARGAQAISPGPGTALEKLPQLADLATQAYGELLAQHLPNEFLFFCGESLLHDAGGDETTLTAVSDGLDRAFDANDKGDPLASVLKGAFYVYDAWCARGNGWANSVTDQGWQLFHDRLASANKILTDVYAAHPEQAGTPYVMIAVAVGQGQPRDQMELWFQRGLKLSRNTFPIYMQKRWYLLPRWYGSDEDEWNFGLESTQSDDWVAKTPEFLLEAITDAAERDPGVYAKPDVWGPVEKIYRAYLDHYPNALRYRTRFLKCATEGGHWKIASEQLAVLGDDWDRSILPGDEYSQVKRLIAAHASSGN